MNGFINEWLQTLLKDKEAAVVTVLNGVGGRPRENGAQMIVKKSGSIYETVGGGKLEAQAIECAKRVLKNKKSEMYHFRLTGKDVAVMDMICGGEGDMFVYYSGGKDILALNGIPETADGWLIFPAEQESGVSFILADGQGFYGTEENKSVTGIERKNDIYTVEAGDSKYVVQWRETPGVLHIFGAGHVSCEIAKIADMIGIACCVYDDREEYANKKRFPNAKCVVLENMEQLPDIALNEKDMVAIVTRGHVYDLDCLKWALKTQAGYVGMIGSKRKIQMILNDLIEKGYDKERVLGVKAPIGLDIGALTPSEIAVSVAAQIIQFRRLRN